MSDHIANQIRAIADWLDGENPFVLGSGATIPFPEASEKAAELRRIAETLEAGVVVVPANVAKRLWLYALNAAADYFAVASDNKRYDGYRDDKLCEHQQALDDARFLLNVIERFQQSGEQPAETRITVTIDVQTWQGYHDRRVIEVEPGIGWPERMAPEVLKAALEMEERHLNGTVKRNGGEWR